MHPAAQRSSVISGCARGDVRVIDHLRIMVGIALIAVTDSRSNQLESFCRLHAHHTTLPPVATADTIWHRGNRDVEQRHGQQGH